MNPNYTVTIIICILSMLVLAIDVGRNTILHSDDIKWFKITFILAALGACCEYLGYLSDQTNFLPPKIHWFITYVEFSVSPYLAICLARSCGMKHKIRPMHFIMCINVLFQTISLFNGMIFRIDSDGHFFRGNCYWIYLCFCGLGFAYILFVFVLIGFRTKLRYIINIILIAMIMIVGQTANAIDGSIYSGYSSICVTATLLYICMQNILRHIMIETINMEKNISNHDALTKVMSRISYDNKIKELNLIIKENPESLAFAVCECDLNNLKQVNDSFGHDKGDVYIINCCRAICHIFKNSPVFRIGGDEFVAILEKNDYDNLEIIKKAVQELAIAEMKKSVSLDEKKSFAVGFAVYDSRKDRTFNDVLKRADQAMYKNKKMLKSL